MRITLSMIAFAFAIIPSISPAEELTVTKTVYLEQGATVDPKAMALTHDNGFIVAGSLASKDQPRSAWAIKTDGKGNVKWRHLMPRTDNAVYGQPSFMQSPVYNSVAVTSDDSVFLCGFMPGLETGAGLITHLDKNGKVLSEHQFHPNGFSYDGFGSCAAWSGGLVATGSVSTYQHTGPTKMEPYPVHQKNFYRIISFDTTGKIKWDTLVPVTDTIIGSPNLNFTNPIQMESDGSFAFIGKQNSDGTELVSVNPNGDIVARKVLKGQFTIALPVNDEKHKDIQLLSIFTGALTHITFSSDLQEIGRVTEEHKNGVVHLAYRLPDQSLMLFGSEPNSRGVEYYAWAMRIDPAHHEAALNLAPDSESLWINAGAVANQPNEFVSARRVFTPFRHGQETVEHRLGAALDFMSIK
jgi:hypothetical protein